MGSILTHEFTHALHFADQEGRGQEHPIWIAEGLATLFESSKLLGGHAVPQANYRLKRPQIHAGPPDDHPVEGLLCLYPAAIHGQEQGRHLLLGGTVTFHVHLREGPC